MITRRSLTSKSSGASVDLIPMIDVVFQLILFFLVSTTFAILPAISVNLPSSQTAEGANVDLSFSFLICCDNSENLK